MTALVEIIAAETARDTFPAALAFTEELRRRYGPATAAVIFYGSCLRQNTDAGLMLDFYVLVDNYRAALRNPLSAAFAWLLPPNVYYHELAYGAAANGHVARAKVAVMSVAQFLRGTSAAAFSSTLWARFSQPTVIAFVRNDELRRRLTDGLAAAVTTMMLRTVALLPENFSARDLWIKALAETYGAELRPEAPGKGAELVDAELPRYEAVTAALLGPADDAGNFRRPQATGPRARGETAWRARRLLGKTLNVLRLIKAAFTFQGGLDYVVWKIARHSGVQIELTAAQRQRPLLTGARLFWRTLKRGGIR